MVRRLFLAVTTILMWMGTLAFESKAQSIHPFYENDDIVFRPELLGKWTVEGIPVEFAVAEENAYVIRLGLDSDSGVCFLGHVIRLDGRYFLDVQIAGLKMPSSAQISTTGGQDASGETKPAQSNADSEIGSCSDRHSDDNWFLNREHLLFLVNFTSDTDSFDVEFWNDTWISKMAQDNKFNAPYTKNDDDDKQIVFFGSRSEMRELVISLPAEAFESPEHLERVSTTVAKRRDEPRGQIGSDEVTQRSEVSTNSKELKQIGGEESSRMAGRKEVRLSGGRVQPANEIVENQNPDQRPEGSESRFLRAVASEK